MDSIKIIMDLKNPVDYEEYKTVCVGKGITALPLFPYINIMGMMLMGMHKYPDIPPYEAFMKIQQEANEAMGQPVQQQSGQPAKAGCGSCGGGVVV